MNDIVSKSTVVYAMSIKDKDALINSSSGGAFTAVSDLFLDNGDAVVCTTYNYFGQVSEFRLLTTTDERNSARGSKYMQSRLSSIFSDALHWLKANPCKNLLFVGMGCQAEGFRKFAEVSGVRDRVWIVDIICHGSSRSMIWSDYARSLEHKYDGKIETLSFRDKRNGWSKPTSICKINDNEISLNDYMRIFYNRCALRPSCYICPFASTERNVDITIGDFWHIKDKIPDFYSENGVSVILIHTNRGTELFEKIKPVIEYRESDVKDCWQWNLEKPTPMSSKRKEFWNDYNTKGLHFVMNKDYESVSHLTRLKRKLAKIIRGEIGKYRCFQFLCNLCVF